MVSIAPVTATERLGRSYSVAFGLGHVPRKSPGTLDYLSRIDTVLISSLSER